MLAAINHHDRAGQLFPALKFAVILAGFFPRPAAFRRAHPDPTPLPILSIFGEKDFLREDCQQLPKHFTNLTEVMHQGGHEPPNKINGQNAIEALEKFLKKFID